MEADQVKAYYRTPGVVEEYAHAANQVGLWRSEEKIFSRLFKRTDTLLELGCGAGRIALGLWELGYAKVIGIDFAREMVEEARRINRVLEYGVAFRVADATRLDFADDTFEGAIFGFNGLMQIPGRERRRMALREVLRVVKKDAWFAFTTHDRENPKHAQFWADETKLWAEGKQDPALGEFGDRVYETQQGRNFIHVPTREEVLEDLAATGWRLEADVLRSQVAKEPEPVRDFSDDCRFWVVQKP